MGYGRSFQVAFACFFIWGNAWGAMLSSQGDSSQSGATAQDESIFASDVFNWRFYLNNNPDLTYSHIVTEQGARDHWQQYGRKECRRAHPTFDVAQYLEKYSDLKAAYGSNCVDAISHYLRYGRNEGRVGLVGPYFYSNRYHQRVTIGNGIITIGMSSRVGGSIDSLYFHGKEFINSWDHGRQLQFAWQLDNQHECNNPTEAGSSADGLHNSTHSRWIAHSETTTTATTTSYPAFWLGLADRPDCESANQLAGNKLEKFVQVGGPYTIRGISVPKYDADHLVEISGLITIPAATPHFVLESASTHVGAEFSQFYSWEPTTCGLTALPDGVEKEQGTPIIAAVPGGEWAIGQWSADVPSSGYRNYGYGFRHIVVPGNEAASESKINVVYRMDNVPAGKYATQTYVAVGSLEQVRSALCAVATITQ